MNGPKGSWVLTADCIISLYCFHDGVLLADLMAQERHETRRPWMVDMGLTSHDRRHL